jgi:hypothetical protein
MLATCLMAATALLHQKAMAGAGKPQKALRAGPSGLPTADADCCVKQQQTVSAILHFHWQTGQANREVMKPGAAQPCNCLSVHLLTDCRSPQGLPTDSMSKLETRLCAALSSTLLNAPADCLVNAHGDGAPPKALPKLPRWDPKPLA